MFDSIHITLKMLVEQLDAKYQASLMDSSDENKAAFDKVFNAVSKIERFIIDSTIQADLGKELVAVLEAHQGE